MPYTEEPVCISIEIEGMTANYDPECVYQTNTISTDITAAATWSTRGCSLNATNTADSTITCCCTHLSTFSTQNRVATVADIIRVTGRVESSDDTDFERAPIMLLIAAVIMIVLFCVAFIDWIYGGKQSRVGH